jgi:hypothetical protein
VSWDQRFFDPIILPGRKPLVTLREAALYITKPPKAEHDAEEWQAAMQALLLVAEHNGPPMFARIGITRSPCPIRYAIKCRSVAASSAQRRHASAR